MTNIKKYSKLLLIALWLFPVVAFAVVPEKKTFVYADRDGEPLKMDVYSVPSDEVQPCIVFVFGGGFKEGRRDAEKYKAFFHYFATKGFVVTSIDYRLGMKGQKAPSLFNRKPMARSIQWAVEDLYTATAYIIEHATDLNVDTTQIIVSGSSAGAITVLQADYEKRNDFSSTKILPAAFQYAGVISFSGAIYSTHGIPSYRVAPAPTLLFHGDLDRLVPYKKVGLFHVGMFGSKVLARQFKKHDYPYLFYSMANNGHEVAEYPMVDFLPEIHSFIIDYVFKKKRLQVDVNYCDVDRTPELIDSASKYYQ